MATKKSTKRKDYTLPIITHILGIFSSIVGALLVFVLTKDKYSKKHARNALNWQISLLVYNIVLFSLSALSVLLTKSFSNVFIVFPFSLVISALTILNIIFCIVAALKANDGILWDYPLSMNFLDKIGESRIEEGKREIKKAFREVKKDFRK